MPKKLSILFLALLLFSIKVNASHFLDILIYSNTNIDNLNIKVQTGEYTIVGDDASIGNFEKNTAFELAVVDNKIKLTKKGKEVGMYDSLFFNGKGFINTLLVKPAQLAERFYDNDFKITVVNGFF